jgi:hypothetical protein
VFDKVHFAGSIRIPQIDREDVEGRINLTGECGLAKLASRKKRKVHVLNIDLFFSLCISDYQADAGGRRDWSSILMKQSDTSRG